MKREVFTKLAIGLVLAIIAVGCAAIPPVMDVKVELTEERIARGKYLAEGIGACSRAVQF